MEIIVENELALDSVTALLPEAHTRLNDLSKIFESAELVKLVENLAKSEPEMAVAIGSIIENMELNEFMVKHVNAKGEMTRTKDRKTRERQASQTTGLSKSARRAIARKASKTKRANPSGQIKAGRLTKKARAKRKSMYGLRP